MQCLAQLIEQSPHGPRADYDVQLPQLPCYLHQSFARPQTASASGIAGSIFLEQAGEGFQETGRFFSTRGRPPPG